MTQRQLETEAKYDEVVEYFNNNKSTVRKTAKACGVSKSAVHYILTKKCPNPTSMAILAKNKAERHIRGGQSTKRKYQEG